MAGQGANLCFAGGLGLNALLVSALEHCPDFENVFVQPAAGQFGDAGRNIIKGPGQVSLDMSLSKSFTIKESRSLELRLQAANVFNIVQFTSINTVVNSLTFGEVTSAAATRRITMIMRFRF